MTDPAPNLAPPSSPVVQSATEPDTALPQRSQGWFYVLAVLLGAITGFAEMALSDLLVTAFCVLFFCMLLGFLRPRRPWRWVVLIGVCVPVARLVAAKIFHIYTERAQIYEAFLAFMPGIAGAYSGHFLRRFWGNVMAGLSNRHV